MKSNLWIIAGACALITGCVRYEPGTGPAATAPAAAAPAGEPAELAAAAPIESWSGAFNNAYGNGSYYFTGLPSEDGLRLAADEGVKVVVNLLTEGQQAENITFDEPAVVAELGQTYVTIPIRPASFSKEDVARFADAVEHADGPVLVHCASSNRCGALWAAYLNLHQGVELERAIELGRSAGLGSDAMVEAVRRVVREP